MSKSTSIAENQVLNFFGTKAIIDHINKKKDSLILTIGDEKREIPLGDFYDWSDAGEIEDYNTQFTLVEADYTLSAEQLIELARFQDYLDDWSYQENPKSRSRAAAHIEKVALQRGDSAKNIPSASTLFQWYDKFVNAGFDYYAMLNPHFKKRGKQCHPDLIDMFYAEIDEHYLVRTSDPKCKSISECWQLYKRKADKFCEKYNIGKLPNEKKIKRIGRSTFYDWVKEIDPFEVCQERYGFAEARKRYRSKTDYVIADAPLQRVQIDAVHLNLGLVNDDDKYIGMPVVYFAIDVFTRCIIGYVISYHQKRREDLSAAVQLIKTSLKYKRKPEHTEHTWPLWGLIDTIQHDSGIFSSAEFHEFLNNIDVSFKQNRAKTPWVNGYIERFNRTFREMCCKKIPDYMGSRNEASETKNIKALASCKPAQLQKIVEAFVLDLYHQKPHRGLDGLSPAQMAERWSGAVDIPTSKYLKKLDLYRGIKTDASIQEGVGIQKKNVFYNNQKLINLRERLAEEQNLTKKSPKVDIYYSQLDISSITVIDPKTNKMFPVQALGIHSSISLKEYESFVENIEYDPDDNVLPVSLTASIEEVSENKNRIQQEKEDKRKKNASSKEPENTSSARDSASDKTEQLEQMFSNNTAPSAEESVFDESQQNDASAKRVTSGKKFKLPGK